MGSCWQQMLQGDCGPRSVLFSRDDLEDSHDKTRHSAQLELQNPSIDVSQMHRAPKSLDLDAWK